ncbi:TPA: hook protein [Providencia rettgeri]|nr:hook protein [Providencia rettgeri]HEM8182660.1 hook protein [Providencia rettgeri]
MTIEQLQEENAKLKQAIIHMYLCKFKSKEGRTFYLVDRSSLNCAYDLAKPKE